MLRKLSNMNNPSSLLKKEITVPTVTIPRPQWIVEEERQQMIVTLEKRRARLARERRSRQWRKK